ncbi:hypothetical protein CJ305_16925 [Leeuwenhoekiella nanhaiensis]|uniref:Uncharacterized protein n=1 Tax=Leeuwenhoekiella nanhaiensis TaxID=1655491 RepID=A0A2G1VNP7_9FLAO|nr:hypothetical protein CJ305_16925 [Leeuwenhoekiella nanhaiensis]
MKFQGVLPPIILGLILIVIGFLYRRYLSKNGNEFDTPIGKLYGISILFICCGFLIILLALLT